MCQQETNTMLFGPNFSLQCNLMQPIACSAYNTYTSTLLLAWQSSYSHNLIYKECIVLWHNSQ